MVVMVTSGVIATLLAEAARAAPEECCGILLGVGERIEAAVPAANVAADRRRHFEVDPAALLAVHRRAREGGPQVVGYYHSHPAGQPAPSATDRECASGDARIWAIVAGGDVALWRDDRAGFTPVDHVVRAD